MGKNNDIDRELLSAYLDDALSDSERRQVESLLANDVAASRYLEQLRATRDCLRSLASDTLRSSITSGRSSITSGRSSIASRVISLAQATAVSEELPANHPIRLSMPSESCQYVVGQPQSANFAGACAAEASHSGSVVPSELAVARADCESDVTVARTSNRLMWSGLAVLAATLFGLAALPLFRESAPENLISQVTPEIPGLPGTTDLTTDVEVSPFENSVAVHPAAEANDARPPRSPVDRPPAGVLDAMEGKNATENLQLDVQPVDPIVDFLFMCEVVLTKEAWNAGRFDALLDELGIPVAGTILAEPELLMALEESKVIGVGGARESSATAGTSLVFVQGSSVLLDRLIVSMESDPRYFGDFSYDLAIDEKKVLLAKLLRRQAGRRSSPQASARFIVSSDQLDVGSMLPRFGSSKRETVSVSTDKQALGTRLPLGAMGESDGELLIVLREAIGE